MFWDCDSLDEGLNECLGFGYFEDSKRSHFVRHRQAWTHDETQKLKSLAEKGMGLKAIAKALTRSEDSTKKKAKQEKLKIKKLR